MGHGSLLTGGEHPVPRLTIRLSDAVYRALKEAAARRGKTIAAIIA
jgi:predicted DNA-binding ribbon-helix-helix protein